jgi:hypothetical protein
MWDPLDWLGPLVKPEGTKEVKIRIAEMLMHGVEALNGSFHDLGYAQNVGAT